MPISQSYVERLRFLRERDGLSNAADAARAYGIKENTFRSIANGTRGLTAEHALRIARHHKVSPGWLVFEEGTPDGRDNIRVWGFVAAGQEMHLLDEPDAHDEMVSLRLGSLDCVAVEVRGSSMYPVYRNGDIVFLAPFTRAVDSLIGEECAVQLEDGRVSSRSSRTAPVAAS